MIFGGLSIVFFECCIISLHLFQCSSFLAAAAFGRSGTGGLERGAMRRSVSATRGATTSGNTNMVNRLVMKSRPVQTSLTRDPAIDCPDVENPGQVNFQVQVKHFMLVCC